VTDPKKVNPRFAAIAEEIEPPPAPKPKPAPPPRAQPSQAMAQALGVVDASARSQAIEARAGQLGLVRGAGESDDELRDRVAVLLERGSELVRAREGGRELVMFEGREHYIAQRIMSGFTTEETYVGCDGQDLVTITIKRQADMRDNRIFGADGGYVGRIKR